MINTALAPLAQATLAQRKQTEHYLTAILANTGCESFYRPFYSPRHTALVCNPHNPPSPSDSHRLEEHLDARVDYGLICYQKKGTFIVTSDGVVATPMTELTHVNLKLLPEALKREQRQELPHLDEADWSTAWPYLPAMIRNNWRHFQPALQKHIMSCMTQHLQKQEKQHAFPLSQHNTLFAISVKHSFPSIPIKLVAKEGKTQDLMDALTSPTLNRRDFCQFLPAETEEVRYHKHAQSYFFPSGR